MKSKVDPNLIGRKWKGVAINSLKSTGWTARTGHGMGP